MNTFYDMRNEMLKLFKRTLDEYPLPDTEEESENNNLNEDMEKRRLYIVNYIREIKEDKRNKLILLLLLYYYLNNVDDMDNNTDLDDDSVDCDYLDDEIDLDSDFEDELMDIIENLNKFELLDLINDEDNDYLNILVDTILEADTEFSSDEELEKGYYEDFDEYDIIIKAIEENDEVKSIIEKLHPCIKEEEKNFKEYQLNLEYLDKCETFSAKSLVDFLNKFIFMKNSFTKNSYFKMSFTNFLNRINEEDKKVYNDIAIFILKYYYIRSYLHNKDNIKSIKESIMWEVQKLDRLNGSIIEQFLNFNLNTFTIEFSKIPKSEIDEFSDLITLENIKTYGENGAWNAYNDNLHSRLIFKCCPHWKEYIRKALENSNSVSVYLSANSEGLNTIPRLCIIMDKENNVLNILGKDLRGIEFEMLDILDNKVEASKNYDVFKNRIGILKYLGNIYNKIINNIDLTKDEIDVLYGINKELLEDDTQLSIINYNNTIDLESHYLSKLRSIADERKNLSIFYDCKLDEVALTNKELNEDTVVTTYFSPDKEKVYYPKLKIIFCNAWCDKLITAEGLNNLEYIKGIAKFRNLKSSKGLSKLIKIGGDATFTKMEDIKYFNPNLVIEGNIDFGYDGEDKIKRLKK